MAVIYLLLPLALLLALGFLGLFVWATRDGQFDDVKTPRLRVLFEEDGSQTTEDRPDEGVPREGERG